MEERDGVGRGGEGGVIRGSEGGLAVEVEVEVWVGFLRGGISCVVCGSFWSCDSGFVLMLFVVQM